MSTKHNTKHPDRGKSRYPARLSARGATSASVRMESLETLRSRQERREAQTGSPVWTPRADAVLADTDVA